MNERVTIIVLAFNIEAYIEKCLNSIIGQTYGNIEVIIVDDGSSDMTGVICDEYARRDNRISVIHQTNQGVNACRKEAIMNSTGDYIGFVDGDDWIEENMYERMLLYALDNDADVVTASGYRDYEWGRSECERLGDTVAPGIYKVRENNFYIIKKILTADGRERINGAVWSKLFRANVIKKVMPLIEKDLSGEMDDNIIVLGAMLQSQTVCITHDVLYHHRERNESYTNSQNQYVLEQVNHAYIEMKRMIIGAGLYDELYVDLCKDIIGRVDGVILKLVDDDYLPEIREWKEKYRDVHPKFYWDIDSGIPIGSKVIIYGYGNVGKSYKKQFERARDLKIVAISDKKYEGDGVIKPEEISSKVFDYIILALFNEKDADEAKTELIARGIEAGKIVWKRPLFPDEYYD